MWLHSIGRHLRSSDIVLVVDIVFWCVGLSVANLYPAFMCGCPLAVVGRHCDECVVVSYCQGGYLQHLEPCLCRLGAFPALLFG